MECSKGKNRVIINTFPMNASRNVNNIRKYPKVPHSNISCQDVNRQVKTWGVGAHYALGVKRHINKAL